MHIKTCRFLPPYDRCSSGATKSGIVRPRRYDVPAHRQDRVDILHCFNPFILFTRPDEVFGTHRFLIRDRDTKFTKSFSEVFASIGAETILTPVRSPKANAFAERWVPTVREDCLDDHMLVLSRRHLERTLSEYVEHYNRSRPHRGVQLTPPRPALSAIGGSTVVRHDLLGGLIHEYELAA
jgi:putative transposase